MNIKLIRWLCILVVTIIYSALFDKTLKEAIDRLIFMAIFSYIIIDLQS